MIDLDKAASDAKSVMEIYGLSDVAAVELVMRVIEHNHNHLRGSVSDEQFSINQNNKG